jgi:glycosyltransferase involved in cell wall biosynthesis
MNALLARSCGNLIETAASNFWRCRILYIIGQLGGGGSERQLLYLLRELDRKRYPPGILVWNFSPSDRYVEEIKSIGVPIYWFTRTASQIAKLRALRRFTRSLRAEVIHSCSFFTNFAAYWAAWGASAVAVGSLRGEFTKAKEDSGPLLGRLGARWPQSQIYNSVSSAEIARRSRGIFSPKHIDVIRNGLDLQQFCVFNGYPIVKEYIVGVGSLLSLKRWDRVLTIVDKVRREGAVCKVRIAGDGSERGRLEKQALALGISEYVEFLGATLDVRGLLAKSRFLVHTSETEGCPNAVMEAMACGRPVVAMDAGDIPLLVEDGKTGFVIRQGDEETFARRVVQLLSDDDVCHRMGLAARIKAEREFGLDHLVTRTLDAYRTAGWRDRHSEHSQAETIHPR